MRATRTDIQIMAASMASIAAMLLCFSVRSTTKTFPDLPGWDPPAARAMAVWERAVDINTAGLEELMALPGIGEVRAQAILDDREEHGPYRYPEDLIRVEGIGEGILFEILNLITTGGERDAQDLGSR